MVWKAFCKECPWIGLLLFLLLSFIACLTSRCSCTQQSKHFCSNYSTVEEWRGLSSSAYLARMHGIQTHGTRFIIIHYLHLNSSGDYVSRWTGTEFHSLFFCFLAVCLLSNTLGSTCAHGGKRWGRAALLLRRVCEAAVGTTTVEGWRLWAKCLPDVVKVSALCCNARRDLG